MRKRIRGRVLAGILAAVLLCTTVPETVYAVEGAEGTAQTVQEQVETGDGQPETAREDDKNPGEGEIPEDDKTPENEENPEGDKTPGDGEDLEGDGTPGDGDAVEGDLIPGDADVSEGDTVPGEQETEQPEDGETAGTAGIVEELPEVLEDGEEDVEEGGEVDACGEITAFGISSHTQKEAMEWLEQQKGKSIDYDGVSGCQCVDLIKAYYAYLGQKAYSGHATDYTRADRVPSEWSQISYGVDTVAQPGDILVWKAVPTVEGAQYGHIGIVLSADKNGCWALEQNSGNHGEPCTAIERKGYKCWVYGTINCLIRPKFKSEAPPAPSGHVHHEGSEMCRGSFVRTVSDGDYHIVSALEGDAFNPGSKCLTIGGLPVSKDEINANVELWAVNGWKDHVFTVKWIDENYGYHIKLKDSGWNYLRILGDRKYCGTNVTQFPLSDNESENTAQQWVIEEIPGGYGYTIRARISGFYVDVADANTADGTNIQLEEKQIDDDQRAQRWYFVPWGGGDSAVQDIADGEYEIVPKADNSKAMSITEGLNVELGARESDGRHVFQVNYLGQGYYKIENKNTGLSLDVRNAESKNGTNVQVYKYWESANEAWLIKSCGDGYYRIISKCNGLCVDLANGNNGTANIGTNISMWNYYGGNNQKWQFIPYGGKPKLIPPTASIPTGTEVENGTAVSLSCGVSGVEIYYTLDGTEPGEGSSRYTSPIVIEKDTVIKAVAVKSGHQNSDTAVFTYTVKAAGTPDKPEVPDEPETPDVSGRGDVLEEDVPQGKVENIPHGLWMSAVPSQVYTGKAIKPEVRVYDYKTLLTEKKDYTISYKNNTKANAAFGANPPAITVTGKGNYTGKETQAFVIRPKRLSDVDVVADDITLQYNGRTQKPVPVITWDGRKLSKNRDYTLSYPDEERDGAANPGAYTKEGEYTVLLCGVGNYAGERKIRLTITRSRPASVMKVDKVADQVFTGEEVRPVLTVKDDRSVLTEGEDYEISFQNNVKVGTAFAVIAGKGTYTGTKRVPFRIVQKASLNQAKAELAFGDSVMYTGGEVKPAGYKLTVSARKADGNKAVVTLAEGTDFTVSYKNNIKPGTATILFQGINGYTGTLKKTYKISAYKIGESAGNDGEIRVELADAYAYAKGGCKPEPVVFFQGKVLKKGTDYTLSYKNNTRLYDGNSAGKQPTVRVNGKGCFTGSCELTYKITAKDMDGLTMSVADRVWQNRGNIYQTKVVIRDVDGKALSAGRDYEKLLRYEYGAAVTLPDGTLRRVGEEVSGYDILPAGTLLRVTATAKGDNYTGEVSCYYRIAKADIGKAKVTIPAQTYSGREIRPDGEIQVKLNGQILTEDNYEVTGYADNINKGTATVTIRGRNDCGGVKTVKFRIKGKGFLWWWR